MRAISPSEHQIQCAIVDYLRLRGCVVYHIPNEGKRSKIGGHLQKRGGMTPGAPDLVVAWPNGHVLWIEVKSAKGKLTPAQEEQRIALVDRGHDWLLARSADDVIAWMWSKAA